MAIESEDNAKPLIGSVTSQDGSKTVIAGVIQNLHLESTPTFTTFHPYATLPPLPTNFIDRPELTEPLLYSLLQTKSPVSLTALEGMGGVGKSITALSLCHNKSVQSAFPDGIVWLTFGKQSAVSLEQRVEQVAIALNQRFPVYNATTFRSLLSNKAALIVLDDVWTLDAAEPFLPPAGRSRLLYTSRNRDIAGSLGAESHEIGVLNPDQARQFLLRWSAREQELPPEPILEGVLAECKGLVLALAMIGGTLRNQHDDEWAAVLLDLRNARLKQIGKRPGGYAHETLHASIAVSVDALDLPIRQAYYQLAVLLEDMPAPPAMLQAIWGGDLNHVHRLTRKLVDQSLAGRDVGGSLRVHDLQLDFLHTEHPDPAALALIHATVRRSLHIIATHPEQFSSQLIGRLLPYIDSSTIANFVEHLDANAPRPRLRSLWPTLQAAGNSARVLEGHNDSITGVALSADGRWALSGSEDGSLRVWDLQGNAPTRILENRSTPILSVAMSPDGRWALSGGGDLLVRIWDLQSNAPPRILEGHSIMISADGVGQGLNGITALAISADSRWALSGSTDCTTRVWDLHGDIPTRILRSHSGAITALAMSADGRWALSGSADDTMCLWDLQDNAPPRILENPLATLPSDGSVVGNPGVAGVAMSVDGKWAISASKGKVLQVWDLQGDAPTRILESRGVILSAVAISADGRWGLSGASDATVQIWDLHGNTSTRILEGGSNTFIRCVAMSADGRWALSGALSGARENGVHVWDLQGNSPARTLEGYRNWIFSVATSADGKLAISGSLDGTLRVWHLQGDAPPRTLEGHVDEVTALAMSADGKWALSASSALEDGTTRIWDLEGNTPTRILDNGTIEVQTPYGRELLAAISNGNAEACNFDIDPQSNALTKSRINRTYEVAMSADGKWALLRLEDHTMRLWDLQSDAYPRILEGHSERISALAMSADGKWALLGLWDETVCLWNLQDDEPTRILKGHRGGISTLAMSADGRWALSGSSDKTVRVWDLQGNEPTRIFEGHSDRITSVALSANGRWALSGSVDKTVRVWDLRTSRCLSVFTCDLSVISCTWAAENIVATDRQLYYFRWEE